MILQMQIEKSFSKVRDDWERLYLLTEHTSPFLHPKAMEIAVRYCYPYYILRLAKPLFLTFREEGNVRAIMPVLKKHDGHLQLFGDFNGFNESGFLYDSKEVIPNVVCTLRTKKIHVEFLKIDCRSPLAQLITPDAISTSNAEIRFEDDYVSYVGGLTKSVRQNIRTAYNRLVTDKHNYDIKVFYGGENELPLEDIIGLYCKRHESRYGVRTGILKRWFLKSQSFATRCYRDSTNAMTVVLYIDDRPAAFLSGLFSLDRFIVPRLSIDDHFRRYSPGMILVVETIRYLQEHTSIRVLDLSQGNERYKYQLGAIEHLSYRFTV